MKKMLFRARKIYMRNFIYSILYRHYKIGRYTYGYPIVYSWNRKTKLDIGSFCSIGNQVKIILGGEHRTDWVTTFPFSTLWEQAASIPGHPSTKGDVIIGNDVWIGAESIILSGVKIGNGAVIGAGSVVAKDVPPYAIVAGNPARILRYRFDDDVIEKLNELRWWDWDDEKIINLLPELLSNDIQTFIQKAEKL